MFVHGDRFHPQYATTFLRRTEGAFWAYRLARTELIEFLHGIRGSVVSPYFRALLGFEVCLSQTYQAYNVLEVGSGNPDRLFKEGDGSPLARLNSLYNTSKHMAGRIKDEELPLEATAAIWLTNTGLKSNSASLSFDELLDLMLQLAQTADRIIGGPPPPGADTHSDQGELLREGL